MLSNHRLWPARLRSNVAFIFNSSDGLQRIADDPLRLFDDRREVALAAEALGVNLVQALGPRRSGGEPATRRDELQAADRRVVPRSARQLARDRLTSQCSGAHRLR